MMAVLKWLVGLIFTVIVAVFAVMNRGEFSFTLSPFPGDEPVALPVYVVVLCALAVGFLMGALSVWLSSSSLRQEKRRQRREIKILEKEVGTLKEARFAAPPSNDLFPALPAQKK